MELLVIIVVVVVIWVFLKSGNKKSSSKTPVSVSIETSINDGSHRDDRIVDTGKLKEISGNSFCLNGKSPFPITLEHLSKKDALKIKKLLDGEAARWERNVGEIAHLVAKNNIEYVELEDYIEKTKTEIFDFIEKKKNQSHEWAHASDKDKEDLVSEFQIEAIECVSCKPSNDRALEILIFGAPGDVTADDELVSLFSGNEDLYRFYISNLGRSSKAISAAADDYYRKHWESLCEMALAKRGKDIPVKAILEGLRMKDINEYFSDRLEKKLTRKAKAVEYAESQPDVLDVLSKHMSFRELFQVSEPEGINVADIRQCYEYASAQAEIIKDTYVAGYRTLYTLSDAKDADYDSWEVEAEDCCNQCSKSNGKKTKRKPSKLPPFHVGCTCSLEGIYE